MNGAAFECKKQKHNVWFFYGCPIVQGVFFTGTPPKSSKYKKLIWARLGVSRPIYVLKPEAEDFFVNAILDLILIVPLCHVQLFTANVDFVRATKKMNTTITIFQAVIYCLGGADCLSSFIHEP